MGRRYNRPSVRQVRTPTGRRCYAFDLCCACGWSRRVGGTYRTALRAANAHWARHVPPPWRPGPPLPFRAAGRR